MGLPRWLSGKEYACQCRRHRRRSLGREGPLEEEMENHSSILAWRIPQTEDLGRLKSMGSQRVRCDWAHMHHQMARTWLIAESLPNFCPHFHLRANQRKLNFYPHPSHRMPGFSWALQQFPPYSQPPIRILSSYLFSSIKFSHFSVWFLVSFKI